MKIFAKISLFIVASVMLFSGCTDENYYTTEEYYTTCDHDYAAVDAYYDTVSPSEWLSESGSDGPYLYAVRKFPEVTANVINNGFVFCYLIENGRDNPLPYIRPWDFNSFNEPYSQTVRFNTEPGKITFIIEASDLDYPNRPSGNMEFKVIVIQNFIH